jgi:site-specific recombinase XerD
MYSASGSSPCEPRIDPVSLADDAIRNGATLHEVREFAGHADIRTNEIYLVRKGGDAEVAARRIHIRVTGRTGA